MSNFLKKISEKVFPPLETYIADSEADGGPRARGGDIGHLPGAVEEKMIAYQNRRRPSASDLLKGGQAVSDALKQIESSTAQANRTKKIFLKSRKMGR